MLASFTYITYPNDHGGVGERGVYKENERWDTILPTLLLRLGKHYRAKQLKAFVLLRLALRCDRVIACDNAKHDKKMLKFKQ